MEMASRLQPHSSQQLKPSNALTRLSREPGHLDYNAYRRYLVKLGHVKLGHVKPFDAGAITIDALQSPQNSNLQALWSQDNLPEVIYAFDKPSDWLEKTQLNAPPIKQYEIYGARLRDIPILPDHISSDVEGWRIEAWMRFDPRIFLQDIIERMPKGVRPQNKSRIQMRSLRFRDDCKVLGWVALGKNYDARRQQLLREMIDKGIDPRRNSTRGLSWGLVDLKKGEAGGRVNIDEKRRVENTVDMRNMSSSHLNSTPAIDRSNPSLSPSLSNASSCDEADDFDDDEKLMMELLVCQNWQDIPQYNRAAKEVDLQREAINYRPHSATSGNSVTQAKPPDGSSRPSYLPSPQVSPWSHTTQTHARHSETPLAQQAQPQKPSIHLQRQPKHGKNQTLDEQPVTTTYDRQPLTLKTHVQRAQDIAYMSVLSRQWHPYGSMGRRLQLAYLLDIDKIRTGRGWRDNRGWWPPVNDDGLKGETSLSGWECVDEDVIYF